MTQQAQPTEIDLRATLTDAMDGNLSRLKRRNLLDAYRSSIEARVREEANTAADHARAEACAEGECAHAVQAEKSASEASRYRHELEGLEDYLEDREHLDAHGLATLRSVLVRALDR
jgi:hypothetical protein